MIGREITHFRIEEVLGRGGMGVVYRATDIDLERIVAIKTLPPELVGDAVRRARFLREARSAAAVNHPNVATVYEVGETGDTVFIAMELIDGESLRSLVERERLATARAVEIATDIARALAAAHEAGVIHRDLKPGNVMLDRHGQVKLLDFGLAKSVSTAGDEHGQTDLLTAENAILGTPEYMSPEQCRGRTADARSDVFSFGTLLYELLTGRRPFTGESHPDLAVAIIRDEPTPIAEVAPEVSPALAAVVKRCLQKLPADRYPSAGELLRDLVRAVGALDGQASSASSSVGTPAAASPSVAPTQTRARWSFVALGVAAVAVAVWTMARGDGATRSAPPSAARPTLEPRTPIEQVRLTSFPSEDRIYQLTASSDGRSYIYNNRHGVWRAPVEGGPPERIGDGGSAYDAFEDGRRLLVEWRDGADDVLGIFDMENQSLQELRRGPHDARKTGMMSARLAPDERRIAFVDGRGLQLMSTSGDDVRLLVPLDANEISYAQAWSPDGDWIAYVRDTWTDEGWETVLEVVAADGSQLKRLPTRGHLNQFGGVHGLAWPAANRIIYGASVKQDSVTELWSIGMRDGAWDGKPQRKLFTWPYESVDWLRPTDAGLLFVKNERLQLDTQVIELDGSGGRRGEADRLTDYEGSNIFEGWTRDGKALFTSDRHGTWDVFQQAVGSRAELVAGGPGQEHGAVAAGDSILYWSVEERGGQESPRCSLMRLDPDGQRRSLLTLAHAAQPEGAPPSCASVVCPETDPAWCFLLEKTVVSRFDPRDDVVRRQPTDLNDVGGLSPDGRKLARIRGREDQAVVITDLATGAVDEIALTGDPLINPGALDWLPNGRGWLVATRVEGGAGIASVDAKGNTRVLWSQTNNVIYQPRVSADGRYLGFIQRRATCNAWLLRGLGLRPYSAAPEPSKMPSNSTLDR